MKRKSKTQYLHVKQRNGKYAVIQWFSVMTCFAHLGDVTGCLANKRLKITHWDLSC